MLKFEQKLRVATIHFLSLPIFFFVRQQLLWHTCRIFGTLTDPRRSKMIETLFRLEFHIFAKPSVQNKICLIHWKMKNEEKDQNIVSSRKVLCISFR